MQEGAHGKNRSILRPLMAFLAVFGMEGGSRCNVSLGFPARPWCLVLLKISVYHYSNTTETHSTHTSLLDSMIC